jgi:hypothetical protein
VAENATELPVSERQDMGLLGTPSGAEAIPVVNAAGRPYDPSTGRLLPTAPVADPIHNEQPTVTTQAKHSRDLYDGAAYFGISEAEADSIETPTLRKMLRTMTAENERARDAQERARFWENQRGPKPDQQPLQPLTPPQEDFDLGEELDPNANPKTFGLLKRLAEKEKLLDQKLSKLEEREGSRTQQAYYDAFDDAFGTIGDPRLGEGSREEMKPDSPEMEFRTTLIKASGIDFSKHTPAQAKRAIAKTYKTLYPDGPPAKIKKPADVAAAGYGGEPTAEPAPKNGKKPITTEEWNRGAVGAPTRRAPEQLPEGREKAIAAVAALQGKQTPNFEEDRDIKAGLFRRNGTPGA